MLNPSYSPENPLIYNQSRSLREHLDLSDQYPLRRHTYPGAPFWYFLAMKYTDIADSDGNYDWSIDLPDECEAYSPPSCRTCACADCPAGM